MEDFNDTVRKTLVQLWFEEDDLMEILWALDHVKKKSPRMDGIIFRLCRILGMHYPNGKISWNDNRRVIGNEPRR